MKAKLVKKSENHYDLYVDGVGLYTSTSQWTSNGNLLSPKNCQAIERGYDLDELAEEWCKGNSRAEDDFIAGFQKALEILGDRKFTEEDIKTAIQFGWDDEGMQKEEISEKYGFVANDYHSENINLFIQSLQQNEWEVEVEMEEPLVVKSRQIHGEFVTGKILENAIFPKPKLDADGCLILKS